MDDVAIKVEHVSKTFKLPHEKQSSIKGALINLASGGRRSYETQQVLKDISFEIKKGEFFGIVGRNGSGKSTLLKMLAGIYTPTGGSITINGKLTPFIELGVGFSPELTGRENVFLNGALLGFNRKEMDAMYDDIVAFAELERFMDQRLKNYSSGMQVRLAFSIAIRAQTDILVLDEVLAVGDANFQRKCVEYFRILKKKKKTVILVTHSMDNITDFCDRALLIDDGKILREGTADMIADHYELINLPTAPAAPTVKKSVQVETVASITNVSLENNKDDTFTLDDDLNLTFDFRVKKPTEVIVGMAVHKDDGSFATYYNTEEDIGLLDCRPEAGPYKVALHMDKGQFGHGSYSIDLALYDEVRPKHYLARKVGAVKFIMLEQSLSRDGVMNIKASWKVTAANSKAAK